MALFSLLIGLGLVAHQAIADHVGGPDKTAHAAAAHDPAMHGPAGHGHVDLGTVEHGTDEHGTDEHDTDEHDTDEHDMGERQGNGHGHGGCEHTLGCGMQATCSPAMLAIAAELAVERVPVTGPSRLPLDYASRLLPPAAPPPRI